MGIKALNERMQALNQKYKAQAEKAKHASVDAPRQLRARETIDEGVVDLKAALNAIVMKRKK